ncbi:hypothetical protein AB0J20_20795 [Micromonospora costi]|uniref:hypothetical protein n=1 Tax=Micromonospora costi TaxID=1530042 RepID=UPI0033DC8372
MVRKTWAARLVAGGSVLLCLVLAGCADAGPAGSRVRESGPPRIEERWISCADAGVNPGGEPGAIALPGAVVLPGTDAYALPLLDDTFTPVAAVLCGQQVTARPGGGQDLVATEQRAEEVSDLVPALRLPDAPRAAGPCTADMVVPPWLALLDDRGRWLRPGIPMDGCGKPRGEVREALSGLRLTTVGTRTLREVESAEAAAAGCDQRRADMVAVQAGFGSAPVTGPPAIPAGTALRLCVYAVPASERGGAKPAGEFAYGRILPADHVAAVTRALAAAGPAASCTTPAGRFALLRPVDGPGTEVYAELDGCHRILVVSPEGRSTLGQADRALAGLLG